MSLEKFIRLSDMLVEFEANLNDKQNPLSSSFVIETHKEEVRDIWDRLKPAYEQCLSDIEQESPDEEDNKGDDERASVLETVKSKFKSAFATYCRCVEQLGEMLQKLPVPTAPSVPSQPQGFKLPPCEIPVFSGDYRSWPTFRDMFTAVCIENPRLSSVEKLFHLNQRTKGEPNDIVGKVPLTNENFIVAWKSLCSRYENKRVLVNNQLKSLFAIASTQSESAQSLKTLQRDINACISMLKLYGIDVESWDPIFIFICSSRLPDTTLTLWEETLDDKTVIPKWCSLDAFLTNRHRTLESVSEMRRTDPAPDSSAEKTNPRSVNKGLKAFQTRVTDSKCRLCPTEVHVIRKCPKFLTMTPQQRLTEIKRFDLCLNCFSKVHSVRNCTSKFSCFQCSKRHNTLLHREQVPQSQPSPNSNSSISCTPSPSHSTPSSIAIQSTSSEGEIVQSCFAAQSKGVLLGTALVKIRHNGLAYLARALVDSGSEGTFISEKLFNTLRLPFKRTAACIYGLNNSTSASVQKECSFLLASHSDDDFEVSVSALVVPHLSGSLPSRTIGMNLLADIPSIPLADPRFYEKATIDLLIGADLLPMIMRSGIKREICGSLLAQETVFGWILTGPIPCERNTSCSRVVSYFCELSLDAAISRFWEVEDLPRKTFLSASDRFCEELYSATTTRDKNGRYIVSLPFKEDFLAGSDIGHSRNAALVQFFRNEARLLRTPQFKDEYDKVLTEYESLGHMTKVSDPISPGLSSHYYLPHHAGVKPDSTTTKVRVVFNASSRASNGKSLNDVLHTGPVLQQDLVVLILNWRLFRYVFNGDITKMYRQILVNPEHRAFQRIIFRQDPNGKVQDYELSTVTFGVNCAPFLAIRTLLQLADDVRGTYPLAYEILRNSMYVDDALVGAHSIPAAIDARGQLIQALGSAGFAMRKWTSNSKEILSGVPTEQLLFEDFLEFDDRSTAKTLGIRWNASSDSFFFTALPFPGHCSYTKREVLSQISRLFDPAGWLAPCIVIAKLIMQTIWVEGTKWDEEISVQSLSSWKSFQSFYPSINSIAVPRWFNYTTDCEVQFHGFSDASEKAYAAALYIRVKRKQSTFVHLVSCKTKVAPLKTLSIPRLELCGATLLAEMIDHLIPQLRVQKFSIFCWTDSTIVLSWLAKPPCFWSTFVANRVSKITQVISPPNWRHVRSEQNPADLASRGAYPQDLSGNDLWWHGPNWLGDSEENWPRLEDIQPDSIEIERKSIKVHFSYFSNYEDILERFSSLPRAIRVIAYVFRFFYSTHPKFRNAYRRESHNVTTTEVVMIQDRLISITQKAHFPNEYLALSARKTIASASSILSLNPFLDADGIMRICGRLTSAPGLSYNEKHPIILPYNCQLSRLLVQFIHSISVHGGNQLVLRLIRTQFWIIKVKNLIKTTLNRCKPCVLYKHKCQQQIMSALPPERVDISRPFTHTGLDFAGPFEIKSYSGRFCRISKGYACIFICFATKAIHLEATSDLSTNTFLAAFSRFVSRRGCPLHLHSDNGTNFVGASKVLAKNFLQSSKQSIESNYAHQKIEWHFIPPGAPHMGGLWEAGVKSFKTHFRKVAANFKHTFEEFQTLLSKIEACLNSRPLCSISQESSDFSALTPGHFLIGAPILTPLDPKISEAPISLVNRWQRLKAIHQHFCIRWKGEYLKELHKRHKWKRPTENLAENMLVVVKDENLPPNCWRLGRISKVHPGSDGQVRIVDITTEKGIIARPITKVVVLPFDSTS
ncbi:uncharacterized protein LOC131997094 [Stomoxys calcitrans]|uniref:uncharacterized protein LOC131997094 n=1 Tax=Stomoxys calcitrans TaxID=35570 RepID=UPI0027E28381|nr:uncharacterized protein LOC131997094 [Stomoxys calcitrans]